MRAGRRPMAIRRMTMILVAISRRFQPSTPREAKGGIKAQSKRGQLRRELVGQALDRRAGELRHRRAARPRPLLRPPRAGARHRHRQGRQSPPRCRARAPSPTRSRSRSRPLSSAGLEEAWQAPCAAGDLRGQAAGRRDAAGHRGGLRGSRALALSQQAATTWRPTAPARTGRTRASTSPPSTTCSARSSTATRS